MSLWLQPDQRVKVSKFKKKANMQHKDKYTVANVTSSRKDKQNDGKYLYSDWGFVRFVGKAHEYMMTNVKDGDVILLKSAIVTKEAYEKEGEKVYPKSEQVVVFDVELYRSNSSSGDSQSTEAEETPVEDDIPF